MRKQQSQQFEAHVG